MTSDQIACMSELRRILRQNSTMIGAMLSPGPFPETLREELAHVHRMTTYRSGHFLIDLSSPSLHAQE